MICAAALDSLHSGSHRFTITFAGNKCSLLPVVPMHLHFFVGNFFFFFFFFVFISFVFFLALEIVLQYPSTLHCQLFHRRYAIQPFFPQNWMIHVMRFFFQSSPQVNPEDRRYSTVSANVPNTRRLVEMGDEI